MFSDLNGVIRNATWTIPYGTNLSCVATLQLSLIRSAVFVLIYQPISAHDFAENKDYDKLVWYDKKLIADIRQNNDEKCHQFFRLLALCHTVMPDFDKNSMTLLI